MLTLCDISIHRSLGRRLEYCVNPRQIVTERRNAVSTKSL